MSGESASTADAYLSHVKMGRYSPAVLKLKLANLRSSAPDVPVFAFEGDDDKIVYSQWIRRLRPTLQYEPFLCNGKSGVLMLRSVVLRDRGGIGEKVFYFVDRDFDDLRGIEPTDNIFMTDCYSVETYLVSDDVVVALLRDQFHCHARPDLRESIRRTFLQAYEKFLIVTREVNYRIFVARKLRIELKSALPVRVSALAEVMLETTNESERRAEEVVVYTREPEGDELLGLREQFDALAPKLRYRGKFALLFLRRWLELLTSEFSNPKVGLFGDLDVEGRVRGAELVISNFAAMSELPIGLTDFLQAV